MDIHKIVRCSRCGHNQKVVKVKKSLYKQRCNRCGYILVDGKHEDNSEYLEYLKSEHWQTTRRLALEHYKNVCDSCGCSNKLEVHHLTYTNKGKENLADLQILCRDCHEEEHEDYE